LRVLRHLFVNLRHQARTELLELGNLLLLLLVHKVEVVNLVLELLQLCSIGGGRRSDRGRGTGRPVGARVVLVHQGELEAVANKRVADKGHGIARKLALGDPLLGQRDCWCLVRFVKIVVKIGCVVGALELRDKRRCRFSQDTVLERKNKLKWFSSSTFANILPVDVLEKGMALDTADV